MVGSAGQDDFEYDLDYDEHDDDDDGRPAHGATWPDPTVVATWTDAALRVNVQSDNKS